MPAHRDTLQRAGAVDQDGCVCGLLVHQAPVGTAAGALVEETERRDPCSAVPLLDVGCLLVRPTQHTA